MIFYSVKGFLPMEYLMVGMQLTQPMPGKRSTWVQCEQHVVGT